MSIYGSSSNFIFYFLILWDLQNFLLLSSTYFMLFYFRDVSRLWSNHDVTLNQVSEVGSSGWFWLKFQKKHMHKSHIKAFKLAQSIFGPLIRKPVDIFCKSIITHRLHIGWTVLWYNFFCAIWMNIMWHIMWQWCHISFFLF